MTDVMERLRWNLRAAGVAATEEDLAGIVEKGFLSRIDDLSRLLDASDPETVPDYLTADVAPAPLPGEARPATSPPPASDDEATIAGVAAALRARRASPVELTEAALAQIAAEDGARNAFQLVLAEAAREAARRAEAQIAAGEYRGPLHGVPVAVKDLFDLAGAPTTAGSKIRAGAVAARSSTVVQRLEAAGAVIVGKTRMSEFAYSPGSNNAHYGPTPTPYAADRDAGGSSSGSAAAVAAGMVYGAVGSDTGGSIRIPAAHCGLVGLKPTFGRISLAGAVTLSWSLDHAGPLARSAADAAIMLEALAGADGLDPRVPRHAPPFAAAGLDGDLTGLRVALLRDDGTGQPLGAAEILTACQRGAAALAGAGASVEPLDIPEIEGLRLLNGALLAMEAAAFHIGHLRGRLDDLGPFMRQRILAAFAYGASDFARGQQTRRLLRERIASRLAGFDLVCLPTVPDEAPALGVPTPTFFTGPFNCLGWPAVHVPTGRAASGIPIGVQLVARPWQEHTLLQGARAVELAGQGPQAGASAA